MNIRPALLAVLPAALMVFANCSALKQLQDSAAALSRLQFKLAGVEPGTLAGVDLAKAADPGSLNALDAARLAEAYASGSWPLTFDLDVAARNPNETGSGAAVLEGLDWTLSIDGRETVTGGIPEPLTVPGGGETRVFPVRISLDLYRYFSDRGFDDVLNLALAVAGKEGTASRITLTAVPTVKVGGIPVRYPGAIQIVDREFSN